MQSGLHLAEPLRDRERTLRGPLSESYGAAVALVVFALVPFLLLSSAMIPISKQLGQDLGLSRRGLELTIAMSDAAYAFGTVLAVQLAQHLPGRRMLLLYVTAFAGCTILTAWAPSGVVFIASYVGAGLCTSLMLIAAVPPLVTGFPTSRMPTTGAIMNLCVFGAVAAGPAVGSFFAAAHSWKPLFWTVAGIAVLAVVFALLTYEHQPPQDRGAPWDVVAVLLAAAGCITAFLGAALLETGRRASPLPLALLLSGLALIVALVVYQYRLENPLMPVRRLTTTFPTVGVLIACCGSACAFGLTAVSLTALSTRDPAHVGLLFLPELGAALVTAATFGLLFRTKLTPVYAFTGLLLLASAAAVLTSVSQGGDARVAAGAALLGLGVGSAVSPALFIAGFSLPSGQIQRVFALIELARGVTAFLAAPLLLYLVSALGKPHRGAVETATVVCLGVALGGAAVAAALFLLGRGRLQTPDLDRWQEEGEPAWSSPPLLARLRKPVA